MSFFEELKKERSLYLKKQEELKQRYYNDAKDKFQEIIENLIEGFESILTEKVRQGKVGNYELLEIPEVSHPAEDLYAEEYEGYKALDLFQLLVIGDFKERSYYLSKEIIKDEVLLEFWEILEEEGLSPYFLVWDKGNGKRRIFLGVVLPDIDGM